MVIVAYLCDDRLEDCLTSLTREGSSPAVVVVDNASSPATAALVARHSAPIRYIDPRSNLGFSAACNLGARNSESEFLLFLNPDTIVAPNAISSCVSALRQSHDVGVVGCRLVREDGRLDHAAKRGKPTPGASLAYFLGIDRFFPRLLGAYRSLGLPEYASGIVTSVSGAFLLTRRDAFDLIGGFDERYWMFGEDIDLCVRMKELGLTTLYWPVATVMHIKGGASSRRTSRKTDDAFYESMRLYFDAHLAAQTPAPVRLLVRMGIHAAWRLSRVRRWVRGSVNPRRQR